MKKVAVIMGSASDLPVIEKAIRTLKDMDVSHEVHIYSAHRTPEEAQKRCDYLANFDGSVFSSGSHKVIGTCLVRTSGKLTASQQNALEAEMVDALTQLS